MWTGAAASETLGSQRKRAPPIHTVATDGQLGATMGNAVFLRGWSSTYFLFASCAAVALLGTSSAFAEADPSPWNDVPSLVPCTSIWRLDMTTEAAEWWEVFVVYGRRGGGGGGGSRRP